ncbi:TonB-dependent receptor [Seonamhaeicola sp. NFXS20]|uniref:SusC/RagA family TonB-linked outer membrane protein n=1 Tax=Seonamhaeicola sp. NFXS20 TaxID=2816959 RepID=UPI003B8B1000
MKIKCKNYFLLIRKQLLFVMRLFIILFCTTLFSLNSENSFSQIKISINEDQLATVDQVFRIIKKQTNYGLIYPKGLFKNHPKIQLRKGEIELEELLNQSLKPGYFKFEVTDDMTITILENSTNPKPDEVITLQTYRISGEVKDEAGLPLPGTNVIEKGTNNGVTTDFDGKFSINVANENAILSISYIGYEPVELPVKGKHNVSIILKENLALLDEVVVIGYGEVRRQDLTGAVSSVKAEENVSRQYNSVDMMLQGRAAGVQVSSNAGNPGQSINVNIRGINTLSGKSQPLYVIDGVIVDSGGEDVLQAVDDTNEYQAPQNGLTGISPQDIASMEVLKDASATAIYGSRGANGVVLITTKKGKLGAPTINVFTSSDLSVISNKLDMMSPMTYTKFRLEQAELNNADPEFYIDGQNIYPITYDDGEAIIGQQPVRKIDWQDEMYETALSTNTGITISGAADETKYYFSANYRDQNGLVKNSNLKNGNLRLNLSRDLTSRLEIDTRMSLNYRELDFAQAGNRSGSNRSFTLQTLKYRPLLTGDESIDVESELSNPYAWINDYDDITEEMRIQAVNSLKFKITDNLKYSFLIGLDYRNKERSVWYGTTTYRGNLQNGNLGISTLRRYSYTMNHLLSYNKKFGKKHRIKSTIGFTYDANNSKYGRYEVADFPVQSLRTKSPQAGQNVVRPLAFTYLDESIKSLLFRTNYTLNNKYLVTASFRADGSSKFADGNKWGFFPAVALAWKLNNEPFLDNGLFDDLKLRVGWGQTGNQSISAYSTLSQYGPTTTSNYVDTNNGIIVGNVVSGIANPDLTWETTNQFNLGLDIGMKDNRLTANIDLYTKNTKDLLQQLEIGPSNGFTTMPVNLGEISNKGIEMSLNYVAVDSPNLNITVGGNIGINRNKIEKLGLAPSTVWINGQESEKVFYFGEIISTGSLQVPANIFMEGQPIGMFWGYKTDGIYQTDEDATAGPTFNGISNVAGDVVFVDQNNDGNIDGDDRTFIGNPNPDFTYGFNLSAKYKRFNLSALFSGVYGNDVANATLSQIGYATLTSSNALNDAYVNAWRTDAPSNTYPRIGWNYGESQFTDRMVESGSFLRLDNITIGYDLPVKNLNFLSKANIYFSANNLFTITNYSGYDPVATSYMFEGGIMGVDWLGTPNAKNYLVGINISF